MTWKDIFLDLINKIISEGFEDQSDLSMYKYDLDLAKPDLLEYKAYANEKLTEMLKDLENFKFTSTQYKNIANKRDFIEEKYKDELKKLRGALDDSNFKLGHLSKRMAAEGELTAYNVKRGLRPEIEEIKSMKDKLLKE